MYLFGHEKTMAVLESWSGAVLIVGKKNQPVKIEENLPLIPGCRIIAASYSNVTLFLYNGKSITFTGPHSFKIKITKSGIKGENSATSKYIAKYEKRDVYSDQDVSGSMGRLEDEAVPKEVKEKIEDIGKKIPDPLMQALVKGNCFRKYKLKEHAREQFKTHWRLLVTNEGEKKKKEE
jgi:hypothetical protein